MHQTHLPNGSSHERVIQSAQPSPKSPIETKKLPPAPVGRKSSWISNISSKFSSSGGYLPPGQTYSSPTTPKAPPTPPAEGTNPLNSPRPVDIKRQDSPSLSSPQPSPKSGHPSFLTNALRRLSSTGGGVSLGKPSAAGIICQRRTMNLDPYRERCKIDDLEPSKLRRVAFCVDVEIAGTARCPEAEPQDEDSNLASPVDSRSAPSQVDGNAHAKKTEDKKIKEKSEGEALKNPEALAEQKENTGVIKSTGEAVGTDTDGTHTAPKATIVEEPKESSRKKEKKKRSEEERKERKERRKQNAIEYGKVPAEVSRESSSSGDSPPDNKTSSKPQERPTTDPLRIYRRCCQLRETPILKRITEQIGVPSACDPASPGTVSCLDLSGFDMKLSDIVTFGDYLAVVPVKKLILEGCGLTDEAVRVILAGLLAAKTPEQAKHNKKLTKKCDHSKHKAEQLGVIEKISLKDNPKIGPDGWRHIGLFIHMSQSLKAIDLSMIPFPQLHAASDGRTPNLRSEHTSKLSTDICTTLQKALAERLGGERLEELVLAECGLTSDNIGKIIDAGMKSGLARLGLASNQIGLTGLEHVARYVRTGRCEGLDLGGNDLSETLHVLAESLDEKNPLYALSLADCNLSPASLRSLFPALVRLPNFRFIDLSHNQSLFASEPSALGVLRKYIPLLPIIKRVHLADVAMSSEQAIALAEILPESKSLAHLNLLENKELAALSSATTEADQEEACALYASLMAAVRVSETIICIDIDVPSAESSEIVKALAKQVVAYSLRNMERGPVAEAYASAAASIAEAHGGEENVSVPDILLHLVGHVEGNPENHDDDEPAPDDDYIVGGTGVVKALGICLGNKASDYRRHSRDVSPARSDTATPTCVLRDAAVSQGKAKIMSVNLLGSARKIRARLQPALAREAETGNENAYKRLQFLDSTLEGMIQRFEDEYPETRLHTRSPLSLSTAPTSENATTNPDSESFPGNLQLDGSKSALRFPGSFCPEVDTEEDPSAIKTSTFSRHNSDVSLASRHQAQEEGRMHRFGQQIRRDILRPQMHDHLHGTTGHEIDTAHISDVRTRIEAISGDEIRDRVMHKGYDAVLSEMGVSSEELIILEQEDPESFEKFKQAQVMAQKNLQGTTT